MDKRIGLSLGLMLSLEIRRYTHHPSTVTSAHPVPRQKCYKLDEMYLSETDRDSGEVPCLAEPVDAGHAHSARPQLGVVRGPQWRVRQLPPGRSEHALLADALRPRVIVHKLHRQRSFLH